MPSEEKRRRAGASGVGGTSETDGIKTPDGPEAKKPTHQNVQQILRPELLEFPIKRGDKSFTLVVPTVFTIGQIVQDEVWQDFDAYVRLVMVELQKVSSLDVKTNPQLMFSRENTVYLDVVIGASNVRAFMNRVLSKVAYVIDPDDAEKTKLSVRSDELNGLSYDQALAIGGTYILRWLDRWLEMRKASLEGAAAKNAPRAEAQT